MRSVNDILKLVCTFLNERNINYCIVGGFAVIIHGNPRSTMDIDFVLQIEEKDIPDVVKFLRDNNFFADEDDMRAAFSEKSHCTVEDKETMYRLDIKGMYNEMDERVLKNKVQIEYLGTSINIASAEDTIANKLLFGREQDINDALGIYVRQKQKLDMNYLEALCMRLGVDEELKRLIVKSGMRSN